MKNYRLAWRNLWRNKRRTLITVASVFFAVFFALVMRSLQLGTYDHMFSNVIESYTGYVQIQHEDFWDNKTIDNLFNYTPELEKSIMKSDNAVATVPRFESFALASSGNLTKGVLVMGIEPQKEKYLSDVRSKLLKYRLTDSAIIELSSIGVPEEIAKNAGLFRNNTYSNDASLMLDLGIAEKDSAVTMPLIRKVASVKNGYIEAGRAGALVGEKLAIYLNISLGDTIVVIGQGYHGTTAAGTYRVEGIVKIPSPDLDNKIVYLPYDICQELFSAPGMLTSLAISVRENDDGDIDKMISELKPGIKPPLRVIGWRQMNELMINQMEADSRSGMIMIGILYLVIAFGIFGTVLMMTAERRREFGVLVALGMQKGKLASVIALEMFYIGFMGIASGVAGALPVIIYGFYHPIRFSGEMARMYEDYGMEPVMPFLPVDTYFLWQSVVVAIIIMIALIYPLRKILKIDVVNSLKA
jgi:putative ABC transport system permease protein